MFPNPHVKNDTREVATCQPEIIAANNKSMEHNVHINMEFQKTIWQHLWTKHQIIMNCRCTCGCSIFPDLWVFKESTRATLCYLIDPLDVGLISVLKFQKNIHALYVIRYGYAENLAEIHITHVWDQICF